MSGPISIGSTAEWDSLLSGTNVVIADFYADWCGPCKMIAPHFEKMAKEYSRPKKVAFAKVNVDSQSTIARTNGVAAMPTFKIFHGGKCIETIKGANPPALSQAVTNAIKLGDAGGQSGGGIFKTPGRTLGGGEAPKPSIKRAVASAATGGSSWSLGQLLNTLVMFVGLYLVSLLSFDGQKSAENSMFNVHRPAQPQAGSKPGGAAARPAPKPAFKTLSDLGDE